MRWLTFAICAIVVVTLQLAVAPRIEWAGARPDWCLVLIVFYALHARSPDALLGAWLVGAVLDLMTIGRFGLLSLGYGLSALTVYALRESLYADNPLTHLFTTLATALLLHGGLAAYHFAVIASPAESPLAACGSVAWGAVYTAVWAPPTHHLLLKFPRALGIRPPRAGRR